MKTSRDMPVCIVLTARRIISDMLVVLTLVPFRLGGTVERSDGVTRGKGWRAGIRVILR